MSSSTFDHTFILFLSFLSVGMGMGMGMYRPDHLLIPKLSFGAQQPPL